MGRQKKKRSVDCSINIKQQLYNNKVITTIPIKGEQFHLIALVNPILRLLPLPPSCPVHKRALNDTLLELRFTEEFSSRIDQLL